MWATKANNYCLFQFKEAIFIIIFESEDEKTFIVTSPTTFFLLLLSYTLTSVCMLSILFSTHFLTCLERELL